MIGARRWNAAIWWMLAWLFLGILFPVALRAQEADCAEVKIVIEQKLSLERQAFDAHMVIRNGLDGPISNVKVELNYLDQNQQPVTATTDPNAVGALFFQRIDRISGIGALDGSGSLAPKTNADIHWLIIPAQGAGGDTASGRMYYIGAKVTYTLAGETTTVDVTPDYVVVRPQPLLLLDYFLPVDVYGDDPMTPEVEPTVPFTLGVRVANVGAGPSIKTTIESAQPRIVENRQGLLIDFRILGGYVDNEMLGKSLLLDFGDIEGQRARMGRWVMETSLAGRFTEFNASFTHADSLGGAVTSLIKEVRAHKLVHDVLVDLAGHDDVPDFLAEFGRGYKVFDSNGGDVEVADASGQASLSTVSNGNLRLTFPSSANLVHVKIADPLAGAKPIARVVRSDGKVLPPQNFWLSKTRNADLSWSYSLHIFDSNPTGDYILEFSQSVGASISGTAYRDLNANGIRDSAEPAEGNLGITLKGVETSGRSVLRQGYTDSSGAFSFTALAPGRYQLEAAVVDGWVNGAWVAGSAGGSVSSGLIKDIVLTAGTVGQGYLIAKRQPEVDPGGDKADVSITVQASRSQLRSDETASVVVTVRNAGEETARGVSAQVAVPTGLTQQSASAGLGTYSTGSWVVGDLSKGQSATLTITVKADPVTGNKDRAISWPVNVTAKTNDPQLSNNSALLGITVLADKSSSVEMSQTLPAQASVLMLVACPQSAPAEQAACETKAAQDAQLALSGSVVAFKAVSTLTDWHVAQRSGAYNVLWLHGGVDKLDDQALSEIKAAVRRGGTLIADAPDAGSESKLNSLSAPMGVRVRTPALGSSQSVLFPSDPTPMASVGQLLGLEVQSPAQTMASSAGGATPVMANSVWGQGQLWLMGFDMLASVQGPSASFWGGYLRQQVPVFTPASRDDPALAGSRVPLKTTVRSNAPSGSDPQDVTLNIQLPTDLTYSDAAPPPARADAQQVEWAWRLAPAQIATGDMRLTMPQTAGTLRIQSTLSDGTGDVLDVKTLEVTVVSLESVTPLVGNALNALTSSVAATQTLIEQAKQAAANAKAAQQQEDWSTALSELASLQAKLDSLAAAPHGLVIDSLRLDVARGLGLAQLKWSSPATPQAVKLLIQSGSGQSTSVSTAFASPLRVRAEDAQGAPVPGVRVLFTAPTTGATASFAGGKSSVEVSTNTQGIATSPALTANAQQGSFSVTAQAPGLAPVSFALTNRSGSVVDVPASMRMVSGTAQTAQIGTLFGAPMVVQVLNASGQPIPGVSVRFAFATQGPSGLFMGGESSATVLTDVSGLATSPAFAANPVVGTHQAMASVQGMSGGLPFTLINSQLAQTYTLESIDGTTQTSPINQAYARRMIVRVVNAQGQPVRGVSVLFSLPPAGPSATFGSSQLTASVVTAADGTAVSPAFVANGQEGAFRAVVTAEGAAQPLYVSLTNLAASGSGKEFEGNTATGTGKVTASISGGGNTCVFNPSATRLVPAEGIWTPLQRFLLPHGLFDFELVGCDPGSEVTITTTWPDLRGITGYLKYGQTAYSNGQAIWYPPKNLRISGNTVIYTIRDGELGDDDLTVNGSIRDPGGPVIDSLVAVPTLNQWALLLLSGLLGGLAVRRVRRTSSTKAQR